MPRPARSRLRLTHLEERCAPAAFAASLGAAAPGEGEAVAGDPAGNAVFGRQGNAVAGPAVVVAKFGPAGTPVWSRSIAADAPWTLVQDVAADAAGNVYV